MKKPEEAAQQVRVGERSAQSTGAVARVAFQWVAVAALATCHSCTTQELLVNVAPKKPNWDLKRDIQPKLDKLERRTQRAIIEIMREQVSVKWKCTLYCDYYSGGW